MAQCRCPNGCRCARYRAIAKRVNGEEVLMCPNHPNQQIREVKKHSAGGHEKLFRQGKQSESKMDRRNVVIAPALSLVR